eukprot:CAMPEP_0119005412 /NCGR_PEP_ID=MMETSP1176-20130426/1706_1 /TAXON_ID=265551 /ORGANISM="Synedropsis recta cf, Strain CCMP1620" /LENGTH=145 /DNA_ID=CAMNT_0006957217 /DNA_START=15 /DNA_END=452 /DNA_ORIENTATION=+
MDPEGYVSFKSSSTVVSEAVYQFLRGGVYGAIWGMVTPFPALGTVAAAAEASTGIFITAAPFSSLSSVPTNAIMFGSILGVQRLSCKTMELARRRDDMWNEIFGFGVTYRYYTYFLGSTDKRLLRHNRVVGGTAVLAMIYATLLA